MDEKLLDSKATFLSLDLDDRLLRALGNMGLVHPTLVQAKAIPLALAGKDILARAKTGSGKTAAYCLPVLHKILQAKDELSVNSEERKRTRSLILVPTRELAEQVFKYIADLSKFCGKDITAVNIATNAALHIQAPLLAELPDVVVSTPAKILKHLVAKSTSLETLETLVIDEADLVLSFGYEEDIRGILAHLPKIYQSMLMSATLNKGVESLKKLILTKPAILRLEDDKEESSSLVQYVVRCTEEDKFLLAYVILKLKLIAGKCILFVNDIDRSYRLKLFLEQFSIRACVLNSELPLNSRYHIVEEFNRGVYDYIIATDESDKMGEADTKEDEEEEEEAVEETEAAEEAKGEEDAEEENTKKSKKLKSKTKKRKRGQDKEYGVSRGIDFKGVAAVINFDFPLSARAYTHRVGRTARGGRRGMSLSFVTKEDAKQKTVQANEEPVFERVAVQQRKQGSEILPYKFDMAQVDGFRYRANDAMRSVTKTSIREARIKEIKQEILNSEKLKAHFEDKPRDLQFLRHDKELHPQQIQPHMRHIPQYLVPKIAGVAHADGVATTPEVGFVPFNKDAKRRKGSRRGGNKKSKGGDPLKNLGKKRR
ncbi:DEAD-domain-containing protein [Linderina pennispora]|uniref:RNA helicase n=1 Tax=Linderina pennispora TaxID=61395 RepID=A0A1Y1W5V9_9FUNG|nr:DEAD-domain-containing protein [Linderina pennispora]ORX68755.1 DEAD-domain-containing protein [Linderina pennispora]